MEIMQLACSLNRDVFKSHRGVGNFKRGGSRMTYIYGNDGYAVDQRSRDEVSHVMDALHTREIAARMATNEDGYTWVIVAVTGDVDLCRSLLMEAFKATFTEAPAATPA